jgi:hypothetical protein
MPFWTASSWGADSFAWEKLHCAPCAHPTVVEVSEAGFLRCVPVSILGGSWLDRVAIGEGARLVCLVQGVQLHLVVLLELCSGAGVVDGVVSDSEVSEHLIDVISGGVVVTHDSAELLDQVVQIDAAEIVGVNFWLRVASGEEEVRHLRVDVPQGCDECHVG